MGATNETVASIQLKFITGGLFLPLLCVFLWENLGDCFKESFGKALFHIAPLMIIMFEGFLLSFTAAYVYERAVIYVLLNMAMANVTLHLMLTNMSKKPFKLMQIAYIYPLVPFLASFTGQEWLVLVLNKLMAFAAFGNFCFDITILSRQFMAHTGRTFFIRPSTTLSSNIIV